MDQLQPILQGAKKHYFWIVCSLVLLLALAVWWMTTGSIQAQAETWKGEISTANSTVRTIQGKTNHPNDYTFQGMEDMLNRVRVSILAAWEQKWEQQDDLLKWPVALEQDFIDEVDQLRPIEASVPYDESAPELLYVDLRKRYMNYVESRLPELAEIIGALWEPSGSGGSGEGGSGYSSYQPNYASRASRSGEYGEGTGEEVEERPVVYWDPNNQGELFANHFQWSADGPTTLQVLYAQEDMWVLEALMHIIARTNGDAQENHEAVVKAIEFIQMGRGVIGRTGAVTRIASASATGEGMYGEGEDMYAEGAGSMPEGEGMYGEEGEMAPIDPAENRYVDKDYQPLPAEKLRVEAGARPPEEAYLTVAKRMPVRMRLMMDQRYLHRLLVECGNANLVVETRQVRINRDPEATPEIVGGSTGGASGGGYSEGGGSSSYGRSSYGRSSYDSEGSYGGGTGDEAMASYDVPVEIYGIVYIYNPPSREALGLETPTEEGTDAASSDAAPTDPTAPAEAAEPTAPAEPADPADGTEPAAPADATEPPAGAEPPEPGAPAPPDDSAPPEASAEPDAGDGGGAAAGQPG